MGKKTPAPPPAPDPTVVANAQTASNNATAQEQQRLNMVGQSGPTGTVNWQADPNSPGGYKQVTTLSPGQQGIYDSGIGAQQGALDVANQQIGRVGDALGKGLTSPTLQTSYDPGGDIRSKFNMGQSIQGDIGPQDLMGAYKNAADASYGQAASRLDPQYELQQHQLETQLANQGLGVNSDAYKSAMDQFGRTKTDAYNQANFSAQNQGLTAENTLFGQSAQQGQFHNAAANQGYTQNLGAAQFANTAQEQYNQQHQQAAQFNNQALGQQFQQDAYSQNLPINEFNALMSSNQVGSPQGFGYSASSVNPTDVLGSYALNSQAANANYQAQMQNQNALIGGMAQLGGAAIQAIPFSDVRLKRDIELIGREADGLGVYAFRYIWDDEPHIGVMAQEAQVLRPHAVIETPSGFLAVDYEAL